MSVIAAIRDRGGGYRVVITPFEQLWAHVSEGERVYVVPDFEMHESEAWSRKEEVIERALSYARQMTALEKV